MNHSKLKNSLWWTGVVGVTVADGLLSAVDKTSKCHGLKHLPGVYGQFSPQFFKSPKCYKKNTHTTKQQPLQKN